jgi:hypothetical protein
MNLRLPYLSIKNATNGIELRDVIPKEPMINPTFPSSPPSFLIKRGRRKKEEKLQKRKKVAITTRVKFFLRALSSPEIIPPIIPFSAKVHPQRFSNGF